MNTFTPVFISTSTYFESSQQYFQFQSNIKIVHIYYSLPQQWESWLLLLIINVLFLSKCIVPILSPLPPPSPQSGCPPLSTPRSPHPPRGCPPHPAWAPSAQPWLLQFLLLLPRCHARLRWFASPKKFRSQLFGLLGGKEGKQDKEKPSPLNF